MKLQFLRVVIMAATFVLGLGAITAMAEDLGAVKVRMNQRLAQVDQLKAKGVIGENNRGMLELRGGDVDAGDAVAAENRDRGIVYAEIAKQTGTTVEQVSRARARQIATASASGVWIQKEDGTWYKK
jgi:uncharacterized protein YdbL (DUF1318 family)